MHVQIIDLRLSQCIYKVRHTDPMFEEHANKLLVIDIAITINISLLLVCLVN